MKKRKIIIFAILILICLSIFVFLSIKTNTKYTGEKDIEKILEYLQNKYSEQFSDIEFLSTIQNKNEALFSCDGSDFRTKMKDSYKHYYKAYSEKNNIEFYVYIDKTKKDNEYNEIIEDSYLCYLTRRNAADKILTEINGRFDNLVEYSSLIKGAIDDEIKPMNIKEDLSRVSKQEEEYTKKNECYIQIYCKLNLSSKELSINRCDDLLALQKFIKRMNNDFPKNSYYHIDFAEIHFETLDGYRFNIKDYGVEYYNLQGTKTINWIR